MTLFNAERIHQARLNSGMAVERLARKSGISRRTIEAIETGDDRDIRTLPITAIQRLAELLGLTLTELFNDTPTRDTDNGPDENQSLARWNRNILDPVAVQALAALLLTRTQVVMTSDIISVLPGWDNLKLRHAPDAINETLEPLGVRIDLNSNEHRVLPLAAQNFPLDALENAVTSRKGLGIDAYRLAHRAITGPVAVSKIGFRAQLRHGALANQRIGRLHPETGNFELSTETRIGLMLDNP